MSSEEDQRFFGGISKALLRAFEASVAAMVDESNKVKKGAERVSQMKQYLERVVSTRCDKMSEAVVKDFYREFMKELGRTSYAKDQFEQVMQLPAIVDEYSEESIESLKSQLEIEVKKNFNFRLALAELEDFIQHTEGKEISIDSKPVLI